MDAKGFLAISCRQKTHTRGMRQEQFRGEQSRNLANLILRKAP